MRLVTTTVYEESDQGQEVIVGSFDMEIDDVNTPAEVDEIIGELTRLKNAMGGDEGCPASDNLQEG